MEKWSLAYAIIKLILKIPHSSFYRKIVVEGLENIPKNKPIIFAPNHQNAVMDPLAMIYSTNKQPVFLARGDAFNNPIIAKIFAVFKILPVFRQRDGIGELKKNEAIFQKSVDVLKNNNAFCLFPEGQHNPQRFLRPLQKAIPRIAFQAEEQTDYKLDIKIIPTGIYYKDKTKSLSVLHIHYGKPIDVLDYVDAYKENPQKAMNTLKMEMSKQLKPLMIDIQDTKNYNIIEEFLTIYIPYYLKLNKLKNTQKNRFNSSKKLIDIIQTKIKNNDDFLADISIAITHIKIIIKPKGISIEDYINNSSSIVNIILKSIISIIFLPLFLIGCIFNFLPQQVAPYISKNMLKDPQYIGSVKFAVGGIIFPIYYLILFAISSFFLNYKYSLIFLTVLPILGLFNVYYKHFTKSLLKSINIFNIPKVEKEDLKQLTLSLIKYINYENKKE